MDIRLPYRRAVMLQQLTESVSCILVLARNDARGFYGRVQPAETLVIMRLQSLFHPIDTVRRHQLGHFERVALVPGHPAVEHDLAVGAESFASAFHQLNILLHPLPPVSRTVWDRQFQATKAELEVLLDIVAGAISGNARLGLSAEQLVDRHSQRVPNQIPKSEAD